MNATRNGGKQSDLTFTFKLFLFVGASFTAANQWRDGQAAAGAGETERPLLCLWSGAASFVGCICWQIMLHSVQQGCSNLKAPSKAADKWSLHFLNLKATPDGSCTAQFVPKCSVAWLFVRMRWWSDNGWDKLPSPANETEVETRTVNDAAAHLP